MCAGRILPGVTGRGCTHSVKGDLGLPALQGLSLVCELGEDLQVFATELTLQNLPKSCQILNTLELKC